MKTLEEFKNIILRNKGELEKTFGVREIAVFGSYVRNEQRKESDLDILVEFHEPIGLLKFIAMENYLSDVLGVKVEAVTRGALKPRIGKRILQELVKI